MYLEFYNLKEKPFSLSPNPAYLYYTHGHREAYSQMIYALTEDSGFMMLTGEVGTGKTLLINKLMEELRPKYTMIKVHFTMFTAKALLQGICNELGLSYTGRTRSELVLKLQEYLRWCYSEGKKSVVIFDEAQNLSRDSLETIRLLSNIEAVHEKFLQILLVGQPEFSLKLGRNDLRQLRERIGLRFRLEPLSREETGKYISHRLRVAGGDDIDGIFTEGAINSIYEITKGIPRRINILCNNALLAGYATDVRTVDVDLIDEASFDEPPDVPAGENEHQPPPIRPVVTEEYAPSVIPKEEYVPPAIPKVVKFW